MEDIFTYIYRHNAWRGEKSISGPGSDLSQTRAIIKELHVLFKKYRIRSILDVPCGDFNWMSIVCLDNIAYQGGDLIVDIINDNKKKYEKENVNFLPMDVISDPLPAADLILCRDCLVHFPIELIFKALKNIVASRSVYFLTTTFISRSENSDIIIGQWRPINLQAPPFNFPAPVEIIDEKCNIKDGFYSDKSLGLWKVDVLRRHLGL